MRSIDDTPTQIDLAAPTEDERLVELDAPVTTLHELIERLRTLERNGTPGDTPIGVTSLREDDYGKTHIAMPTRIESVRLYQTKSNSTRVLLAYWET